MHSKKNGKAFPQIFDRLGNVGLNRFLGNGKLCADFFMGKMIESAQGKYLFALWWEFINGRKDIPERLFVHKVFIPPGFGNKSIRQFLSVADLFPAHQINQYAFGNSEQLGRNTVIFRQAFSFFP